MDNDGNYPVLQEYPLQSSSAELIPAKAQRGLSTFDLEFTCLDADECYIVIGSNAGVAYLINREKDQLHKLKDNEHKSPVSCIKVLISLECLVAVGYKDGAVVVYKIPFLENLEQEKFVVEGLHSSTIRALEWAKNGMKFFSGDENGIVVCTEIDHLEHQSRSRILVNEKSRIVQLSYSHSNLVVSTLFRSFIYSLKTNTLSQIGQKERKCYGPFGAVIFDEENKTILACRPGQRLWKSDFSGTIQETMIFKNALSESCPIIQTLTKTSDNTSLNDFQFERLSKYNSYILIWADSCIVVIDPNQKVVVSTLPKIDPIIDVATSKNEIFILRGLRHILRISPEPDSYTCEKAIGTEEPSLFEEILDPLKNLTTYVKERSDSLSVQTESSPNIFDWLRKKRSVSSPADISDAGNDQNKHKISDPLPDIVSLNADDCDPVRIDEIPSILKDLPQLVTKDFTAGSENDDLLFKVKKKNKKKKKVQFAVDVDAAATRRDREISKPATDIENNDSNKDTSSSQASVNDESNKGTGSSQASVNDESISDNGPNLEENDSAVTANKQKEIIADSCNCSQIIDDNFDRKSEIDSDRLLECVLNAYSHMKNQDSPVDESDDVNKNVILDTGEDVCDGLVNHNVKDDVNENVTDFNKSDFNKSFDADEVYSSLSNSKSQMKETPQSETSVESLSVDDSSVRTPQSETSVESLSVDDVSISSLESRSNEPPKYGVDWVEYKAPELLLDITVSSDHIFCVDVRNQMYFSKHPTMGSLYWIELDQPAEKIATSDSETVVWALYRGTIYAASHKALCLWENTEWISIARDIVSIAVDDDSGWYVRSNGELVTQQNLTLTKPTSYPEVIPCASPALQVAVKDGVLWVLTVSGSLLSRKIADGKKSKSSWKEIIFKNAPGIDRIYLGSKKTGWIIDSNGMIYFIIGVTPETPGGSGELWLVEASSYLLRPTTQLEQVVRRALNSETLTNLIRGKQHLCLSASEIGVWFCKTYDNLLYSNQKSIIGHMWESVVPTGAAATKWNLIAADAINNAEGGLWCVSSTGELFCYDIKSQMLLPVELPSSSGISCLQPKCQSLWLLTGDGAIYIRRGITSSCLQGIRWQALSLVQFGSQQVIHISCSSFVTWACTSTGEIFMRLGSLNPSSSTLNQAWVSVESASNQTLSPLDKLSAIGKHLPLPLIPTQFSQDGFCKVYVGPQGYPVWAIDRKQNVYVREGVTTNMPIGDKWTIIPDLHAKELCISHNAVWLLKFSGKIYRRFGVTEKNPCGDYWKQMPGNLNWLSATEDDDLWGLQNSSIFCHYSFVLYGTSYTQKTPPERMISEDDWEDIMAEDFESC